VLVALSIFNILLYPEVHDLGEQAEREENQRITNHALRERLNQLTLANKNVCQIIPGVTNPPGAADLQKLLPPIPESNRVDVPARDGHPAEQISVADLLDKATVIVANGNSIGSGFFLSDRYIVTNHHVVEDSVDVKIGNNALGGFTPATVVATGRGRSRGTQDLAVIEIAPQTRAHSLKLGVVPDRLRGVTAAGFPGAVISTERSTSDLPETNLTTGIVTSHQSQKPDGVGTIIHTAQIGHGNSGGPLIDEGGCVVGVNSWFSFDADGTRNFQTYNQSIDVDELRAFLTEHQIAFDAADRPCSPIVQQASNRPIQTGPTSN
jgi:S1-C subfamily serine protease